MEKAPRSVALLVEITKFVSNKANQVCLFYIITTLILSDLTRGRAVCM